MTTSPRHDFRQSQRGGYAYSGKVSGPPAAKSPTSDKVVLVVANRGTTPQEAQLKLPGLDGPFSVKAYETSADHDLELIPAASPSAGHTFSAESITTLVFSKQ